MSRNNIAMFYGAGAHLPIGVVTREAREMAASSEANTPEFTDLLSQFKCLGTTDRDTLISELFSLLNGQISREKCAFVLEMSSW